MMNSSWLICPVCGGKTRDQIRKDTVLINYPLYCPKCKQTTLINVCLLYTSTVGLSLGITPELNLLSRSVLILLMFFGRVGGLTLIFAALSSAQKKVSKLPKEKITVG